MARKSRFRTAAAEPPKLRVYNTGAYIRLSVLDGHQCDSDSIENQEALVRAYIENDPSLTLYDVYSDNGETGVNFERDDFERLLDDIRAGRIDCVIVKDLSRFGRNYIEAGEYLEKVFPFMGVRFIAVNDGYDSLDPATSDSLSMHLKNLVNDVYARDIS
ncbi:recombinase family protein, partial [Hungatella effluvii]|uniref:recombinase family protein n=1 Tax=Hungatella effluvii TaxID=1096246 RepID=UPI002A80C956